MSYRLTLSARAARDIDDFLRWLGIYDAATAAEFESDLSISIRNHVLERPHTWPYFFLTGRPYRGYLYNVSRRTNHWLVYTIDDDARSVDALRFWNGSRDPRRFVI